MNQETFPCTGCGACCRRISPAAKQYNLPTNKDGSCQHLKGNLCSIYDTRPDVCRVDKQLEEHSGGNKHIRKFLKEHTIELCNEWIKEDQMDDNYLIKNLDSQK